MMAKDDIINDIALNVAERLSEKSLLNYGLLGGDFGDILFLYHYSRIENSCEEIADNLLDKMFHSLHRQPQVATYCNGLSGLGMGLLTLQKDGFIGGVDTALDAIDPAISHSLDIFIKNNNIDFLHGLIGIGFYLLDRQKSRKDYSITRISKIIEYLHKSKISQDNIVKWKYNGGRLSKPYNISLSHGVSSIVVFLSRLLRTDLLDWAKESKVKEMLRGTVRYILANRVDTQEFGCWFASSSIESDDIPHRSRLAWCYGDLGVATALLEAGKTLNDSELKDFALRVLLYSAKRKESKANFVNDFCVCHGSVGIAQIFRSHGIALKEKSLLNAAEYWENDTLQRVVNIEGRNTLLYYDPERGGFRESAGILNGIAGAGLYFLGEQTHLNKLLLLPWQ